ncbi:MAG: SRPBCC family protein [Thermoleophilaceae bacterium]
MADYTFLTTWAVDAPLDAVWDAIHDSGRWPEWWKGVEKVVELEPGDDDGVGGVSRYTWKSRLPYRLEFDMRTTRVERPHLIEGVAQGELAGSGRWRFFDGRATAVTYEWTVSTTERWMNLVAPIARPLFAWNHDVVMRQGGEGLARRLGARLLVAS